MEDLLSSGGGALSGYHGVVRARGGRCESRCFGIVVVVIRLNFYIDTAEIIL